MCVKRLCSEGARQTKTSALLLLLTISAAMHPQIASAQTPTPTPTRNQQAVIGWDGDKDGVMEYMDGSYYVRGGRNLTVSFGIFNNPTTLQWYNDTGYLPVLVTDFVSNSCNVKISNFGHKITTGGHDYVAIYSRVKITNGTLSPHNLCPLPAVYPDPSPTPGLVPLTITTSKGCTVNAGQTVIYDYVIAADRFGGTYDWPTASQLAAAGSWDTNYSQMATYWNQKLGKLATIVQLPDTRLINAYKAGYIYTHIVKDGTELKVGEQRYEDEVFESDKAEILASLLTIGDPDGLTYLDAFPTAFANPYQIEGKWKYPWLWAIYLAKSGNTAAVAARFDCLIRPIARQIEADRCSNDQLMHPLTLWVSDYLTMDNWEALTSLASYKYISDTLACGALCTSESSWAETQYNDLLNKVNAAHKYTIDHFNLYYLPIDMYRSNDNPVLKGPAGHDWRLGAKDANWACTFSFGHWAWDGYLFGANQTASIEVDMIDDTYAAGFRAAAATPSPLQPHNFGAFHPEVSSYSTVYNAGYGNAALRGESYRSEGIYAYQFMLDNGQSGPFCWWESFYAPGSTPWTGTHPSAPILIDTFSCPHMTGQATATKVLIDSLIALKSDGSVIIGRGVPNAWVTAGKVIEVANFPITDGNRMGFTITGVTGNKIDLDLTGAAPSGGTIFDLRAFKNNISSVTAGTPDSAAGTVTLSSGTTHTTVYLTTSNPANLPTPTPPPSPTVTPTPAPTPTCSLPTPGPTVCPP